MTPSKPATSQQQAATSRKVRSLICARGFSLGTFRASASSAEYTCMSRHACGRRGQTPPSRMIYPIGLLAIADVSSDVKLGGH